MYSESPPFVVSAGIFSMATTLELFRGMAVIKEAQGVDFESKRSDGNGYFVM